MAYLKKGTSALALLFFLPLDLAVVICLWMADLIGIGWRLRPAKEPPSPAPSTHRFSIIILNWDGKPLLEAFLPSVVEAVRHDGAGHEIIVVDNGSRDGSIDFLRNHFPAVRIVALAQNHGFAKGNNIGVQAAQNDIVVLLNNDMQVERDFLAPLRAGFQANDVFAVSCQIFFQDKSRRREETGRTKARWRRGFIELYHEAVSEDNEIPPLSPIFWGGGGSCAFDRRKFLALGGFDPLYHPFYLEDADLSYQAWKRGWRTLFAPQSRVHHRHRGTTGPKFGEDFVNNTVRKNQYLFVWKNITDLRWVLKHSLLLPWVQLGFAHQTHLRFELKAFWRALQQLPEVVLKRQRCRKSYCWSDAAVFEATSAQSPLLARVAPAAKASRGRRNILVLTAHLPVLGLHGGATRMFHNLRILAEKHAVTVLSFIEGEHELGFVPQLEAMGLEVHCLLRRPCRPQDWLIPRPWEHDEYASPEMAALVRQALSCRKYDVIQVEYLQMGQHVPSTFRGLKILTEHEVHYMNFLGEYRTEGTLLRKIWKGYDSLVQFNYEIRTCRRFDRIACMTAEDANMLGHFIPADKIHPIPIGVDSAYFHTAPGPVDACHPARLVFVGNYRHVPNREAVQHIVRDILPLVQASVPQAEFEIIGANAQLLDFAPPPGTLVTGYLEDLRPACHAAAVFVAPIRSGNGMRVKLLEALSLGMSVVATPLAASGFQVQHRKHLMLASTPEEFAGCVVELLGSPQLRSDLGRNARQLIEQQYDWRVLNQQFLELVEAAHGY